MRKGKKKKKTLYFTSTNAWGVGHTRPLNGVDGESMELIMGTQGHI